MGLPDVQAPYLPPREQGEHEYCLVLDLDETLVHFVDVRDKK